MKIALYISGEVRTLFYKFHKNIELLRDRYIGCEIDVFYSFWDSRDRSDKINDGWHFRANNYEVPEVTKEIIDRYFNLFYVKSIGEVETSEKMNQIMESSPFDQKGLSSQYYKMERVVDQYFKSGYDLYFRIRSDILIHDVPPATFFKNDEVAINENYWYCQPYDGENCNEMILVSTEKNFEIINRMYSNQDRLSKLKEKYGEFITGSYLRSLNLDLKTFNFNYRVVR